MTVWKVTLHDKPALGVKQGSVSARSTCGEGSRRIGRCLCGSTDRSEDVDVFPIPQTPVSQDGSVGFDVPGTTYYFRVQVLTMTGGGDWSQIVSLLVK